MRGGGEGEGRRRRGFPEFELYKYRVTPKGSGFVTYWPEGVSKPFDHFGLKCVKFCAVLVENGNEFHRNLFL